MRTLRLIILSVLIVPAACCSGIGMIIGNRWMSETVNRLLDKL